MDSEDRNAVESAPNYPLHPLLPPCQGGGLPPHSDHIEPLEVDAVEAVEGFESGDRS